MSNAWDPLYPRLAHREGSWEHYLLAAKLLASKHDFSYREFRIGTHGVGNA